jgi:hypothetical protein
LSGVNNRQVLGQKTNVLIVALYFSFRRDAIGSVVGNVLSRNLVRRFYIHVAYLKQSTAVHVA